MVKAFAIEDISSRDYRVNVIQGSSGLGITIQHTVIRGDYVSITGQEALSIYKELKRSLRGGKTAMYNKRCATLIAESHEDEEENFHEATKPNNQLIIKLYAGDVLVREINSEEAWIAALNSTIKVA